MNPYSELPPKAFWRQAIADRAIPEIDELWAPKFDIRPKEPVVTFGSCFAQHIGKALHKSGYHWRITEPPPPGLSPENATLFNYNVFSARTGNIYTTTLLEQWTSWALGKSTPPGEIWEKDGAFFDPFRPRVEPEGFVSPEELLLSRQATIDAFRESIVKARYFVFTLGLTESWVNGPAGYEYPMCPGTAGGVFDPAAHKFVELKFQDIRNSLFSAIQMMRTVNKRLRFILTVSPVPLTATKSGKHVLVATMHSKSILRAVAGQLSGAHPYIDYFPSYEIISSPPFQGMFFEPNKRSVTAGGVAFVMGHFFRSLTRTYGEHVIAKPKGGDGRRLANDEVCEEELLAAFGSAA
jgi:hypothetical protein